MHPIDKILELQLEGKNEEARKISDDLENLGPDKIFDTQGNLGNPDTWIRHRFNRGWFKLQEGNYQEGSQLLESGRFIKVYGNGPLKTDKPMYNPQIHDIKNKGIIISLEGGYGDEIIHAKFASSYKKLGASKVYLAADPSLHGLFKRIEGVDEVIQRNQAHLVEHDFWIPGFSSGWVAGHTFEDLPNQPFLIPNYDSVSIWKEIIKSDLNQVKVGIRWAGNPKFEHQQFRKFPEKFLTNLSQYPQLKVFSLQRDQNLVTLPSNIVDLQHFLISWEDTAAAIMNLDLIITSCTSIAHLAAGLGKETWVMVPILPYHTWAYNSPDSETSPFYNCARLFRQKEPKKWNNTFQKMYRELEKKFHLPYLEMPNEDREYKKLNLGCGSNKIKNFVNVDINSKVMPDKVIDLNQFPWPFEDKEFDHILAKDIIEYLGDKNSSDSFRKIIEEMYRISENGAVWEVQMPHWRCDLSTEDLAVKNLITLSQFKFFNKKDVFEKLKINGNKINFAMENEVDIEILDIKFDLMPQWKERTDKKEISDDELTYALNTFNNVAHNYRLLIQVHKPSRYTTQELELEKAKNNQEKSN